MFYKPPEDFSPPDIADLFLADARADQLTALAKYFDAQAQRLRLAAAAIRRTERHRTTAIHGLGSSNRAFLATGARIALLIQRGHPARHALAEMKERTGQQTDVLRAALAAWRRHKKMLGIRTGGPSKQTV